MGLIGVLGRVSAVITGVVSIFVVVIGFLVNMGIKNDFARNFEFVVAVGSIRHAEGSNPLSSPRCKVYPYEIGGQSLERGGMSNMSDVG